MRPKAIRYGSTYSSTYEEDQQSVKNLAQKPGGEIATGES